MSIDNKPNPHRDESDDSGDSTPERDQNPSGPVSGNNNAVQDAQQPKRKGGRKPVSSSETAPHLRAADEMANTLNTKHGNNTALLSSILHRSYLLTLCFTASLYHTTFRAVFNATKHTPRFSCFTLPIPALCMTPDFGDTPCSV